MKHHNQTRKFGREKNQRKAFVKGLVSSLIIHGKIETTEARAKEIRPFVDRLVTYAKDGTIPAKRLAMAKLYNHDIEIKKLWDEYAPKYATRNGGYTRVIKLAPRLSDSARMAIIEFV